VYICRAPAPNRGASDKTTVSFSISTRANALHPPLGDLRASKISVVNNTCVVRDTGEEGGDSDSTDEEEVEANDEFGEETEGRCNC
jgi:hypothetical protein